MALAADFLELVSDYKADLFARPESWLTADDTAAKLEIIPSGYLQAYESTSPPTPRRRCRLTLQGIYLSGYD